MHAERADCLSSIARYVLVALTAIRLSLKLVQTAEQLLRYDEQISQHAPFGSCQRGVGVTTVRQPFAAIGDAAYHAMLEGIERPNAAPRHITLGCKLVMRDSTRRVQNS